MNDKEYIKQFSAISIYNVCCDLHLVKDYSNIANGVASKKKLAKVRKEIERRVKILNENK